MDKLKTFHFPSKIEGFGFIEVKAASLEEAKEKIMDGDYEEGLVSWETIAVSEEPAEIFDELLGSEDFLFVDEDKDA